MGTLDLAPFRAVRFAPDQVGDLGAVTAPPYDMIDAHELRALRAREPHNIVHLTLTTGAETPETLGERFRAWQRAGILRTEPVPALYAYDQLDRDGTLRQRGVLGALALRAPEEGVILPHEEVSEPVVEGRRELLRACGADLEPILLAYDGGIGATRAILDDVAGSARCLLDVTTGDGTRHRLRAIEDPSTIARIGADLRGRQALIADGHHRYAAARTLRRTWHGHDARVLAVLVDEQAYPLRVGAINRFVPDITLSDVIEQITATPAVGPSPDPSPDPSTDPSLGTNVARSDSTPVTVLDGGTDLDAAWRILDPTSGTIAIATDGERWAAITVPAAGTDTSHTDTSHTDTSHSDPATPKSGAPVRAIERLDQDVIARLKLPGLRSARYVHGRDEAVRTARRDGGVAFVVAPVPTADVLEVARSGRRMPRKSTSFGPKPRTGLLIRPFDDA